MTEIADALRVDPARMGTARLAAALSEATVAASSDGVVEQVDTTMPIVHPKGGDDVPRVVVKPAGAMETQTESIVDDG